MVKNIIKLILFSSFIYAQKPIETITHIEIQNFGIKRFIDLFSYTGFMQTSSIDGFNFKAEYFNSNTINIFINGIKKSTVVLNSTNMNYLPISIDEIEKVELYNKNSFGNYISSKVPAINFITKKNNVKLSTQTSGSIFNEVGDPGPYRYVAEKESPNIDHNGPDAYGSINMTYKSIATSLSHTFIEHRPLDERLQNEYLRKSILGTDWPSIEINKTKLSLDYLNKTHNINFNFLKIAHDDFTFLEELNFEIPITHKASRIEFSGNTKFKRWIFNYGISRLKTESLEEKTPSRPDLIDIEAVHADYQFGLNYDMSNSYFNALLFMKEHQLNTIKKNELDFYSTYSRTYNTYDITFNLHYNNSIDFLAPSMKLNYEKFNIQMSYIKVGNMTFEQELYTRLQLFEPIIQTYKTLQSNISYQESAFKIQFLHETIYSKDIFMLIGQIKLNPFENMNSSISLSWKNRTQSEFYQFSKFMISTNHSFSVYPDLSFWLTSKYTGQKTFLLEKLKPQLTVNIGLNKKMWKNQVNINLGITNIFNQRKQDHILGRDTDLTLEMKISAMFNLID